MSDWSILQAELGSARARVAELEAQLEEVSMKWLCAASERDELLPIKRERDELRSQRDQIAAHDVGEDG